MASSSCWAPPHGGSPPAPLPPVVGRGLQRPRQGRGLGAGGDGMDGRDRAPPSEAGPPGGDDEVGERVGQRGRGARPEEAAARGGPKAILAEALGGGEDLLVVGPEQEDEQRLR